MAGRPAVFLDRDGVVCEVILRDGRPYSPMTSDELQIMDGVEAACRSLSAAGFLLVLVTNQPEVARGNLDPNELRAMHERLAVTLPLDDIRVCPHDDADGCSCRKPRPGMLVQAAADHGIELARSYMVGDRWRDVAAGVAAGCTVVLVDRAYTEPRAKGHSHTVGSLAAAADWILKR